LAGLWPEPTIRRIKLGDAVAAKILEARAAYQRRLPEEAL